MTAAIWIVFAVLLSLWTGTVWLGTELVRWTSETLQGGTSGVAAGVAPVIQDASAWLTGWIPTEVFAGVLAYLQWLMTSTETTLPAASHAMGWLIPVAWVGWFLGAAVLTVTAISLHLLVRRPKVLLPHAV